MRRHHTSGDKYHKEKGCAERAARPDGGNVTHRVDRHTVTVSLASPRSGGPTPDEGTPTDATVKERKLS